MRRSRREAIRMLLGGGAAIAAAATIGARGEAATPTRTLAERCEAARRLAAVDLLTMDEVRWLEEHRTPEGFEVTGCVELDDGTLAPRRRRSLP